MQQYQSRVLAEKRDLDEKIVKLEAFTNGDVYHTISRDEQKRLSEQLHFMLGYRRMLRERIASWGELMYSIMVNGKSIGLLDPKLTYEKLVELAGYPFGSQPTATYGYIGDQNKGGILSYGQSLDLVGNEYFNVCDTGNA